MTSEQETCLEHLRSFSNAMLVTLSADHNDQPRARPMRVSRVEDDGRILFLSSHDSSKVEDLLNERKALVTMQGKTTYVSASGVCRVCKDVKLDELWSKAADLWFANGKDDAVVLEFRPITVEAWDHNLLKLRFAFEVARALVTGEPIRPERAGEHIHTAMP